MASARAAASSQRPPPRRPPRRGSPSCSRRCAAASRWLGVEDGALTLLAPDGAAGPQASRRRPRGAEPGRRTPALPRAAGRLRDRPGGAALPSHPRGAQRPRRRRARRRRPDRPSLDGVVSSPAAIAPRRRPRTRATVARPALARRQPAASAGYVAAVAFAALVIVNPVQATILLALIVAVLAASGRLRASLPYVRVALAVGLFLADPQPVLQSRRAHGALGGRPRAPRPHAHAGGSRLRRHDRAPPERGRPRLRPLQRRPRSGRPTRTAEPLLVPLGPRALARRAPLPGALRATATTSPMPSARAAWSSTAARAGSARPRGCRFSARC